MGKGLLVKVEAQPWDEVRIQFSEPVGMDDRLSQLLFEELERIYGVEQFTLRRYSGSIEVAAHVTSPTEVTDLVYQAFAEDSVLREGFLDRYETLAVVLIDDLGVEEEVIADAGQADAGTASIGI